MHALRPYVQRINSARYTECHSKSVNIVAGLPAPTPEHRAAASLALVGALNLVFESNPVFDVELAQFFQSGAMLGTRELDITIPRCAIERYAANFCQIPNLPGTHRGTTQ